MDARYEKVRLEGKIVDCAVLIAVRIEAAGKRRVRGREIATSEAEINWRRFLEKLFARGLKGVKLISASDHVGLKAARQAVLPSVPWQRCQFHLQQNAGAFVTCQEARKTVAAQMRAVFNAPDRMEAERLLKTALETWRKEHPKLAEWAEEAIPENLTVFENEVSAQPKLSEAAETTSRQPIASGCVPPMGWNGSTGSCADVPGRPTFPNPDSCLCLVSALLAELDDEWMSGEVYLNFNP